MNGFLGTGATFRADLNLVLQVLMGLALLFGRRLAQRRQFRAHGFCQSLVMLLNLILILMIMLPAFNRQVEPKIPSGLHDGYYLTAAIHAGIGTLAELLGLYVVLVATKVMPAPLRFQNWKLWMKTTLAVWWIALLFGFGTYYYWYVRESKAPVPAISTQSASPGAMRATIKLTNFSFDPKEITVKAGTTVEWINQTGKHSVVADEGSFDSDVLEAGGRFERKYDKPGVYPYYCALHGDKGGKEMSGVVKVVE
ncbi:MAG TPA: plastocyanin/azurin family copper-binding protein [Blastocatellia bacterium]|nr:plastocyanin/azurin family copper-binding protein [Blastocatellia bacterium]HMX26947.1 plastocyanin/azurin family copper-binding protein [Blastocatellia bacterium]HMY77009.1 plastocyanin/azurin family copper-binding protein [Blastocatellia bacterium]HMZ20051.1 plastocyanin/azurin family copper-binding protein [Blastocatellia bacterium]HNG33322.1 plastocyanin/azurin family copper-binding protein [Blastocatellia bacterium]